MEERLSKLQRSILTVLRVMDETKFLIDETEHRSLKSRQRLIPENGKVEPAKMPPYWQGLKDSEEYKDYDDCYWYMKEGAKPLVQKNLGLTGSKAFNASFSGTLRSLREKDYIERAHSTKKIKRSSRWKPAKHQTDFVKLTEKGTNVEL